MTCQTPQPFTIFTNDKKTIYLRLAYASGLPVDLSICTEIVINLPNADGSFTQLKLSDAKVTIIDPAVLGQFSAVIQTAVAALLNVGELQSIDVTYTVNGAPDTVRFYNALSVFETA